MADSKKKGLALVLAMGGKPGKDEGGEDLRGSERESAGKALAAALKGGDGMEIADAFKTLLDAVNESEEPKMDDESSEDEEV